MREEEVKQLLQETEAILEGHFLLTSGLHSPLYVEKFNLLQWPKQTERLCKELAERFADAGVEVVIGPMTGGILLAHEVGKALETRAIFTERENGAMALRRGFFIDGRGMKGCGMVRASTHPACLVVDGGHRLRQGRKAVAVRLTPDG